MRYAVFAGFVAAALASVGTAGTAWAGHHHHHDTVMIIQQPATVVHVRQPNRSSNPGVYSANVEGRLEQLTLDMQREKQAGGADDRAVGVFDARKQLVREMLTQAGADGSISADERQRIERQLVDLQAAVDDARVRNRAVGGGPR